MNNSRNLQIYRLWAPLYDLVFQPLTVGSRRRLIEMLRPQPYERWLIPGVGTGQDLPFFPSNSVVMAGDLSPAMLAKAVARREARQMHFHLVDAQHLPFAEATFDGVLLSLILSVVPDGALAFHEAWRVLKPGGRIGIFDKFLPDNQQITPQRVLAGQTIRHFGTDPNRRLADMMAGVPGLTVTARAPSLLAGQYQLVLLHKQ